MIRLFSSVLIFLFSIALTLFIFKSVSTMVSVPFYDFDEAHRAENAKRMKEYKSYFVPLSGSGQDRATDISIPMQDNPLYRMFYHVERPFFVYLLMIGSASVFGSTEISYRLPSFLLGMLIILAYFLYTIFANKKLNIFALSLGLITLITSADLWLSSQYAQLDTGLTFFLFTSLLFLLLFVEKKQRHFLVASGLSLALAALSKGQFVVVFVFPIIALLFLRKMKVKDILILLASAGIFIVPWVFYLSYRFGFDHFAQVFFGFGFESIKTNIFHASPPFWYVRWWWESLRPGWTIFLAFFMYDLWQKSFDWKKITILVYIFGSLAFFSIEVNKIWWYVLPLVPAISLYIFKSASDILKVDEQKIANLAIIVLLASLPIFKESTNTVGMLYGLGITAASLYVFSKKIHLQYAHLLFVGAIAYSLSIFYLSFPHLSPYYWETKEVAQEFAKLPDKKCLWVYQMPSEAALFYSNAGEIREYNKQHFKDKVHFPCINYLMTPASLSDGEFSDLSEKKLIFKKGKLQLLQIKQVL